MKKIRISPFQLIVLMIHFELGSAVVVSLATGAKQDAWISVLLATIGGFLILQIYGYLFRNYPTLSLISYTQVILGKYVGKFLAMIYIFYFLYICSRVLRDFGELLLTTSFDLTPLLVLCGLMMIVVCYSAVMGLEVLARTGELFLYFTMLTISLLFVLAFASGIMHIKNLLPILENGWGPVLKTAFPNTLTFPFGELIVFTMFFPFIGKQKSTLTYANIGLGISGFLLTMSVIVNLTVLGVERTGYERFPMIASIAEIEIGNFVQRLDVFGLSLLVIGGFFKIALFFLAAVQGIQELFQIKKQKISTSMIIGVSIITLLYSANMTRNTIEHMHIGLEVVPKYVHVPLQIIVPLFLMIITFFKKSKKSG